MPARWIQVRRMKEQEADGDLPAIAAAMRIIGASYVETLDTKGTDGSNIHLGRSGHDHRLLRRDRPAERPPAPLARRVPPLLHGVRRPPGPQHQPGDGAGRLHPPPPRGRHRVQDLGLHGQRQPVRRDVDADRGEALRPRRRNLGAGRVQLGQLGRQRDAGDHGARSAGRSGSRTSSASSTTSPRPGRASSSSRTTAGRSSSSWPTASPTSPPSTRAATRRSTAPATIPRTSSTTSGRSRRSSRAATGTPFS